MLKKINFIKNYGIFRDFRWDTTIPEFNKVNLFYGLNGAGKSTLATIFNDIKNKEQKYYQGSFKLTDDELNTIDSSHLDAVDMNLYVFNSNFIKENIGEFKNLNEIVYISEENKTAKTNLETAKQEFKALTKQSEKLGTEYNVAQRALENALTKGAKAIKEEFNLIGGSIVSKYSHYNKSHFANAITKYEDLIKQKCDIKDILLQIDNLKKQLTDKIKEEIKYNVPNFNSQSLIEEIKNVNSLISMSIQKCLQEEIGDEIFAWLEEGYRLHNNETKCKYCGSIISVERQKQLNLLFNKELTELKEKLNNEKALLVSYKLPELDINESNFYCIQNDEIIVLDKYRELRKFVNATIDDVIEKINRKINDIYKPLDIIEFSNEYVNVSENILSQLSLAIKNANTITHDFTTKQLQAVNELEKMLVYFHYIQQNISSLKLNVDKITKKYKDNEVEKKKCEIIISDLESQLVDVLKAGVDFNKLLAKFLGRNELTLKFDEVKKGYKIIRNDSGNNASHLSEGEKTAIAFIYFLIKVKENGNNIRDSIIVFDDPISSFDSNHLYSAYSFISTYFSDCKQLFVLTHNFNFFKLMRKRYGKDGKNQMYLIDSKYINDKEQFVRSSYIIDLPKSIKQASSEYTYLFEKLYKFNQRCLNNEQIELDMYMQMSNVSRKILESITAFKVQSVSDLKQRILQLYKCNKEDGYKLSNEEALEAEKIYRFVNAFSHEENFDNNDEIDILLGELNIVVNSTLCLIERADKDHYKAMIKSIS